MHRLAILLAALGCGARPARVETTTAAAPLAPVAPTPETSETESEFRVRGELGTLEQETIDASFQMHGDEINACYHKAIGRKLWYLGGTFELKVRVRHDGTVKQVAVASPLGNYAVERCIAAIAEGLTFRPPKGGNEAEFNYSWNFQARASFRSWGKADVADRFEKHRKDIDGCSEAGPAPPGLRVTFFVGPGGRVTSVGLGAEAPIAETYGGCVVARVASWRFDDPLGKIARATYEF